MFEPSVYAIIAGIGFFAGVIGGMLGVGGGVVMIPGLVILLGQDVTEGLNQHVYHAASMGASVVLSLPAAWRHYKAGAIVFPVVKRVLPVVVVFTVAGVWISNRAAFREGIGDMSGPIVLQRLLSVFLLYVAISNFRKLFHKPRPPGGEADLSHMTPVRCAAVGVGTGIFAGLTGLGGGVFSVPLQQMLLKLKLRNCIANSSAMICFIGLIGATYKNATLDHHGLDYRAALLISALLAPTAIVGGYIGAALTHTLPIRAVRGFFVVLMLTAAWKMATG